MADGAVAGVRLLVDIMEIGLLDRTAVPFPPGFPHEQPLLHMSSKSLRHSVILLAKRPDPNLVEQITTLQAAAQGLPYSFHVVASGWSPGSGFSPASGIDRTSNTTVGHGYSYR
ncbi:MAG: hypothetical protein NVSMB52_14360 [Chloroflexota bacterium]